MRKRVLALIASLSMLMVGLVGVVMAPAASAHNASGSLSCENGLSLSLSSYPSGSTVKVEMKSGSGSFGDEDRQLQQQPALGHSRQDQVDGY